MRRGRVLSWLLVGALACGGNPPPGATTTASPASDAERAAGTITAQDMYDRIAFLASDSLGGRDTPSPGLELAAGYIADQMRNFGLRPAGDSGTFVQSWPYRQTQIDVARTALEFAAADTAAQLDLGAAYFVIPGHTPAVSGPLHFAGTAAAGRGAAIAQGAVPVWYVPGRTPDSLWNVRIGAALGASIAAGAGGVVLVLDSAFEAGLFREIATSVGTQQAPLHVIGMRWSAAAPLLAKTGLDAERVRSGSASPSALDRARLALTIGRSTTETRAPNVVGILAGSDPTLRDEYIVISAHMDHVGIGQPDAEGDSIYNGADDDASGIAVMLETAQAFAALRNRPERSILFLAVSGEEKGLLGSKYFTENLPVPAARIVANINLDMVGRNAPDTVVAIGMEYSTLGPLARDVAQKRPALGLVVAADPWPEERLFFRSDHFHFATLGIPAIFFTTGLHEQYHRPADEVERIDRDKTARVGRLIFHFALEIATRSERPAWTDAGRAAMGGSPGR